MAPLWAATDTENESAQSNVVTIDVIGSTTGTITVMRIGTTIVGTATMVSAIGVTTDHTRKGLGFEAPASARPTVGRQPATVSGTLKALDRGRLSIR